MIMPAFLEKRYFVILGEEYKNLIEKRESTRKDFEAKFTETGRVRGSICTNLYPQV